MSNSMDGDARVADLKKSGEMKTPSSPSESPRSQQASSHFPVQLLLLLPIIVLTPRCQLHSVQAPQSTSKPSRSSRQAQVPHLLEGHFASEFQQNSEAGDPDHGSSATRIHLGHVTSLRICALGWVHTIEFGGENGVSAERRKSGDGCNCH